LTFNLRDWRRLYQALTHATSWTESLIDAHRVGYGRRKHGLSTYVIPKEHRRGVDRWERDIVAFNKLRERIAQDFQERARR